MSQKSKKGSRTSNSPAKEVGKGRPWPDLPQKLVYQIGRQSTLMQNITSFGSITKSWMATPRKCNPTRKPQWPQLCKNGDKRHEKSHQRQEFSIAFHKGDYWPWYRGMSNLRCQYEWEYFVGCSHGILVAKGIKAQEYFLWAPESRYWPSSLPSWDKTVPFMFVTLSNRCVDSLDYVVMVLTGITSPAFVFFRALSWGKGGEFKWVTQDNTIVDPYGSNQSLMQFSNAIGFDGKFYALSLQGTLVVIEDLNDSQLTITALSKHRAVPSVPCKHFRECLVESCGEILLVFLISTKTYNVVDQVEVFRLHIPRLLWVKMEMLGDHRTLFVGANCCMSVNASKVGCRRNCIYFTQPSEEGWWVYDMESNFISTPDDDPTMRKFIAWDEEAVEE